jgi:class 3 adenylate cyclase
MMVADTIDEWLASLGLSEYAERFARNHLDLSVLPHVTDADLEKIGVSLGHRRKMLHAIARLSSAQTGASATAAAPNDQLRLRLTVLFCRLADATALAARLGPDDMRTLRKNVQLTCGGVIRTYNGFLAKLLEDGVVAFFGYPEPDEDDAERALRAALEICVGVEMLEIAASPPTVQIGIATGVVETVGRLNQEAAGNAALAGEVPTLAAKLLALAEPGGIVISGVTRGVIGAGFELRELGHCEVKALAKRS